MSAERNLRRVAGATKQAPEHRYVRLAEASDYAGVPTSTLRDWVRKGRLPAYRMGPRQLQVDLDDLDKLRRRVLTVQPPKPKKAKA